MEEEDLQDHPTDGILLKRFRQGDDDAALHLYLKYADRLLNLAKKETAPGLAVRFDPEDIVQSVFRTFFRRAASGQYEAPEGDELWKLLLVMGLNKVRSRATEHRAGKRDFRKTQGGESLQENSRPDSNHDEAKLILQLSVDELVEQQPASHQAIIRLRIDGFEVQDISERVGRSKRTVERVLQSFRSELLRAALVGESESSQ